MAITQHFKIPLCGTSAVQISKKYIYWVDCCWQKWRDNTLLQRKTESLRHTSFFLPSLLLLQSTQPCQAINNQTPHSSLHRVSPGLLIKSITSPCVCIKTHDADQSLFNKLLLFFTKISYTIPHTHTERICLLSLHTLIIATQYWKIISSLLRKLWRSVCTVHFADTYTL